MPDTSKVVVEEKYVSAVRTKTRELLVTRKLISVPPGRKNILTNRETNNGITSFLQVSLWLSKLFF